MDEEKKMKAAELMYPGNGDTASKLLNNALGDPEAPIGEADEQPAESYIVKPGDTIWAIATRFADSNYDGDVKAGAKDILELNGIKNPKSLRPGQKLEIGYFMGGMSSGATRGLPPGGFKAYEAEVTPGQSLPKQIKVIKMPTPPQAPTGPDGTDENGTRIGTTPKGNRSVASGAGTYIFTPKGKLMLYMTPKIGGLQQTHNIAKQTVTVNFGTSAQGTTIDQKATYDMSGKLISGDNTSIRSGNMGVSIDKDKGSTVDYKVDANTKVSANSKTGIKVN